MIVQDIEQGFFAHIGSWSYRKVFWSSYSSAFIFARYDSHEWIRIKNSLFSESVKVFFLSDTSNKETLKSVIKYTEIFRYKIFMGRRGYRFKHEVSTREFI